MFRNTLRLLALAGLLAIAALPAATAGAHTHHATCHRVLNGHAPKSLDASQRERLSAACEQRHQAIRKAHQDFRAATKGDRETLHAAIVSARKQARQDRRTRHAACTPGKGSQDCATARADYRSQRKALRAQVRTARHDFRVATKDDRQTRRHAIRAAQQRFHAEKRDIRQHP
jgi:hypothetical protein